MKKEIIAAALLVIIFCLTAANGIYLTRIAGSAADKLTAASEKIASENWDGAMNDVNGALELWIEHLEYMQAVMRHGDAYDVVSRICDLKGYISSGDRGHGIWCAVQISDYLKSTARSEGLHAGSIF